MNQKGFVNIAITLVIAAVVGAIIYFVPIREMRPSVPAPSPASNPSPSPNPVPTPNPSPTPTPISPVQPPPSSGILSVVDLTGNKEAYLNQRIRVRGKVVVNVFRGAFPCPLEIGPECDSSMGARLELWQEGAVVLGGENLILLFQGGEPYPCEKIALETYKCGPYTSGNDSVLSISGIWSKDQEAIGWIGTSDGQPPKPIKWQDRYFLNIE